MEAIHKHIKIDKYINNVVEKKKKRNTVCLKEVAIQDSYCFH